MHAALARLFGLPGEAVRVIQMETGGAFGGKEDYPSIIAGHAARLAGIDASRITIAVFFMAGALGGLAGLTETNGVQHMLVQGFNPTLGAEGIGIAILADANPIGIIFAAILFGALKVGGNVMGQMSGIPSSIVEIMEGFVMIFVILSYFVRAALATRRAKRALKRSLAA